MYSKEQNPPGTSFGLEPAEIHCVLAVFCVHLVGANCWDTQVHQFRTLSQFSSVQLLSRVQLFATPWTAVCQASLSITNSWSLLKLMFIEWVMPSNCLILCHPLLLLPSIIPSIRAFSSESVLHIRRPMYWSFNFHISPSNEY